MASCRTVLAMSLDSSPNSPITRDFLAAEQRLDEIAGLLAAALLRRRMSEAAQCPEIA